ncbi:MAG: metallophosphoesterase [Phycisphaerae bacterium]|nr:metallophosphoesterase [Phycisphaerae bacterium]
MVLNLFISILAIACSITEVGGVHRDWKQFPAVVVADQPHELYALGDTHGDEERLAQLLVTTHIIASAPARPDQVKWSAGKAVLVCTGDMIDKYAQSIEVIELMRALQQSASEQGGRVIVTMGNHEAEFLAGGGADKKAADFIAELKTAGLDPQKVAAGDDDRGIGAWLRDLPVAAKVGDWFFCHAGNTQGWTTDKLETEVESVVDAQGFDVPVLVSENSLLEARMHPRPWWDWDGSEPALKESKVEKEKSDGKLDAGEERLRKNLEALEVHHLVFGHQPGVIKFDDGTERPANAMMQKYDGLVFFIDTGMSRGVNSGRGAVLAIHNGEKHMSVSAEFADGRSELLLKN